MGCVWVVIGGYTKFGWAGTKIIWAVGVGLSGMNWDWFWYGGCWLGWMGWKVVWLVGWGAWCEKGTCGKTSILFCIKTYLGIYLDK